MYRSSFKLNYLGARRTAPNNPPNIHKGKRVCTASNHFTVTSPAIILLKNI